MFYGVPARSRHFVNLECLTIFGGSSTVSVRFGLHANIVEEYVLLSALLHDQRCLQSSPSFQHQFVRHPFSRILVCKGGFHVHLSTRVVSPGLCYVAVSRVRENNSDKPLLDDIITDCLCHFCKILIHGHFELKNSNMPPSLFPRVGVG